MIAITTHGKVYHIMRCASVDVFWRCGITFCGKSFDEERDDVEIYPDDTLEGKPACKRCLAEIQRQRRLPPRVSYSYSKN